MKRSPFQPKAAPAAGGRRQSEAEAADWLARHDAGLTPAEADEFARWRTSDPRHAAAVAEIEAAWSLVNRPRLTGRAEAALAELAVRARVRQRRRRVGWTFATIGLAAAAAMALMFAPPFRTTGHATASGATAQVVQPEHRHLPDGSLVVLNSGAQIAVDFSATRRGVKLLQGEAHFVVTEDPLRPFVVAAGGLEARAVGTEFAVRLTCDLVEVLVNVGRVAVAREPAVGAVASPAATPPEPVLVAAGARVTVPFVSARAGVPEPELISAAELTRALAWRGQRVEFSGTPLGEAVALFNRQNELQLSLGDSALATLRVSGCFWADNPAGFARLVESSFGLHIRRLDDQHIEIGR